MTGAERTLIPHVDDVGGSHGANVAMTELAALGSVTCGSVMVPPAWFPEIATTAGDLDLGIHMTLTSESVAFRWRPISTIDPASGLIDGAGHMWPTVPEVRQHARPEAVASEIRAQLERAAAAGIDITHLDSHMGAALAPEFVEATVDIAIEYELPLLFPADIDGYLGVLDIGDVDMTVIANQHARAMDAGVAVADRFLMPLEHREEHEHRAIIERRLSEIGDGVTFLSLHCAAPGDIAAIHPGDAAWRVGEYHAFSDPDFVAWLDRQEFSQSGMRPIRQHLRG